MRRVVTNPFWLVLIPALVSAAVWIVPWGSGTRRGFTTKEQLGGGSALAIIGWFAVMAGISSIAWAVGRSTKPVRAIDSADDAQVYRYLTWVGGLGVLYMYALVEVRSPGLILHSLADQQFNLVKQAIPQSTGVQTLRYATILSGAVAMHRIVVMKERSRVHYVNLVLLILNVLVASRLALLMSILIFIGLAVTRPRPSTVPGRRRRNRGRIAALMLLALVVLGYANYSRNANYYRQYYNISNPVTMLANEAIAYIGSPFQVEVATGKALVAGTNPAADLDPATEMTRLATPSFFVKDSATEKSHESWYRSTVSIDPSLTTNSSLAFEYGLLGPWVYAFGTLVALVAGFLMGHFSRYRSYAILVCFVLGYCFAETWRTYLFSEGIAVFLLLSTVAACAVAGRTRSGHSGGTERPTRVTADRPGQVGGRPVTRGRR